MLSNEILRTCDNEHVAAAALICIGGGLQHRVVEAARAEGLSAGAYVARVVRAFPQKSGPAGMAYLRQRISGDDMPVLAGLAHIVETSLQETVLPQQPCEVLPAQAPAAAKLWSTKPQAAAGEAVCATR